ncbi:unnamed protein product [Protopolystoma xenopodis]|uniref:Uncharacterized protein n=1 Tax=Protopolystoma xenopodis TaxID=117903 RepID=A0A448X081_9PLAT|nr:unnamed protein product [Protopolystoma xenopodis]
MSKVGHVLQNEEWKRGLVLRKRRREQSNKEKNQGGMKEAKAKGHPVLREKEEGAIHVPAYLADSSQLVQINPSDRIGVVKQIVGETLETLTSETILMITEVQAVDAGDYECRLYKPTKFTSNRLDASRVSSKVFKKEECLFCNERMIKVAGDNGEGTRQGISIIRASGDNEEGWWGRKIFEKKLEDEIIDRAFIRIKGESISHKTRF